VTSERTKTIVLVAGPVRLHDRVGHHDYLGGCTLMADLLRRVPGVTPIVIQNGWPEDQGIFNGCSAIVSYDGGGGNQGFLQTAERIECIQSAVDAGAGLTMIHKAIAFPTTLTERGTAWMGGTYVPGMSHRGHWKSQHLDFPHHPVTSGVEPWRIYDGWLNNIQFVDEMRGITPLLWSGEQHGGSCNGGHQDVVAWAYSRPHNGRSFCFTGIDAHSAWSLPGLRRLITNGILWSAGNEIPQAGAFCDIDRAVIDSYLSPRRSPAIGLLKGLGKKTAKALRFQRRW